MATVLLTPGSVQPVSKLSQRTAAEPSGTSVRRRSVEKLQSMPPPPPSKQRPGTRLTLAGTARGHADDIDAGAYRPAATAMPNLPTEGGDAMAILCPVSETGSAATTVHRAVYIYIYICNMDRHLPQLTPRVVLSTPRRARSILAPLGEQLQTFERGVRKTAKRRCTDSCDTGYRDDP